MGNKRRRTASEGAALVSEFRASGLTQAKYAEEAGIKLCSLQYWLKRTAERKPTENQNAPIKFVEINTSQRNRVQDNGSGAVTVAIGQAVTLSFVHLPHPEYLAELTRAMMSNVTC